MSRKRDDKQEHTEEEARHDVKNYLDTVIQTSHDGILVVDNEGRFEFGNEAFFRIFGWPREELLGHHFIKVVPPDLHEFIIERWEEVQAGKGAPYEVDIVQKDGSRRSMLVSHRHMTIAGRRKYCVIAKDITERKQAQEALRFLGLITEQVSDAVLTTNLDFEITYVNRSSERLFGYSREEILGRSPGMLNAEPDAEQIQSDIYKTVSSGGVWRGEHLNRRKDGGTFPCEATIFPLVDDEGNIFAYAGNHRDITERKRTEEKLRQSRERFDLAVRGSNDGLWDWSVLSGESAWWSPRFYELLGYKDGEIQGSYKVWTDLIHPDDRDRILEATNANVENGVPFDTEYRLRTKSGDYKWFRARGITVRDEDGKPIRMAGSIQDIEERKRAEEAATRFSRVLERSLNEIYIFDAQTFHFIQVNYGARENLGYSMEELQDMTPLDLKPEFTAASFKELIQPLRDGSREKIEFITVHRRKDGSQYHVEVHLQLMTEGAPVFVAIIRDITERKQAEEAIERHRLHLEEMVQMRTRELTDAQASLRRVHHRLLNVSEAERRRLAAELHDSVGQKLVAMSLGIQQTIMACEDSAGHEAEVQALQNVGQQCTETIQEIRTICYGLYPPMLELTGLAGSLRQLGRSCEPAVSFHLQYDDSLTEARFDPEQEIALFRMAQEAVSNALKHSEATSISIILEKQADILTMAIRDDGVGFDTTSQLGQGLGLRSMTERARAVGGTIAITSQPGRTSIEATLPIKPPETPNT